MEIFKVYYSVHDCGDGSYYPSFFPTKEEADKDAERQELGEPCAGTVRLIINNGKICLLSMEWDAKSKKYIDVVKKLNFEKRPLNLKQ